MAIIIPSKQIYSINNSKIRNNVIDNVSVSLNKVTFTNDYEVNIFNTTINAELSRNSMDEQTDGWSYHLGGSSYNMVAVNAKAELRFCNVSISFEKFKNNRLIEKVLLGKDKNGSSNIKYSVIGDIITSKATAKVTFDNPVQSDDFTIDSPIFSEEDIKENEKYYPETDIPKTVTATSDTKTVTAAPQNLSTIKNENIMTENEEEIFLNFLVLMEGRFLDLQGNSVYTSGFTDNFFDITGKSLIYRAKKIEIDVYGNTLSIDLKEDNLTYGSGNHPLSIDGNELLQDSAIFHALGEDKFLSNHLATSILNRYKKGKETAVILCDMNSEKMQKSYNKNDFSIFAENIIDNVTLVTRTKITIQSVKTYDFKLYIYYTLISISGEEKTYLATLMPNELEYSSEIDLIHKEVYIERIETNLTYDISDRVIPMVLGENGKDKPMSINSLGKPKVFEVVGSKKYFDGAVWQELTLQEIDMEEELNG